MVHDGQRYRDVSNVPRHWEQVMDKPYWKMHISKIHPEASFSQSGDGEDSPATALKSLEVRVALLFDFIKMVQHSHVVMSPEYLRIQDIILHAASLGLTDFPDVLFTNRTTK